jgi:hypothetical protein
MSKQSKSSTEKALLEPERKGEERGRRCGVFDTALYQDRKFRVSWARRKQTGDDQKQEVKRELKRAQLEEGKRSGGSDTARK